MDWNAPGLMAKDPRLLEGAIFVDGFFADAPAPAVQTFVKQFRNRYQETPDLLAAQALIRCSCVPRCSKPGHTRPHSSAMVSCTCVTLMGCQG